MTTMHSDNASVSADGYLARPKLVKDKSPSSVANALANLDAWEEEYRRQINIAGLKLLALVFGLLIVAAYLSVTHLHNLTYN
jgi:hypothetical protein